MIQVLWYVPHGSSWLGGVNYFRNLLQALSFFPERRVQPMVYGDASSLPPPLRALPWVWAIPIQSPDKPARLDAWERETLRNGGHMARELRRQGVDLASHVLTAGLGQNAPFPWLGWIPDFQHVHLPEFFSEAERARRDAEYRAIAEQAGAVVLSSENARQDFLALYPQHARKARVLRFAAWTDFRADAAVPAGPGAEERFFLVPNQCWAHKNHMVVLEAARILRRKGKTPRILCTGAIEDHRNARHFAVLRDALRAHDLEDSVRFLGVLDQARLGALMRAAAAFINPSLFEGWSTSVEEAKSLGKRVLLSDIPVHREQAPERGLYFDPHAPETLAALLERVLEEDCPETERKAMEDAALALPGRMRAYARDYDALIRAFMRDYERAAARPAALRKRADLERLREEKRRELYGFLPAPPRSARQRLLAFICQGESPRVRARPLPLRFARQCARRVWRGATAQVRTGRRLLRAYLSLPMDARFYARAAHIPPLDPLCRLHYLLRGRNLGLESKPVFPAAHYAGPRPRPAHALRALRLVGHDLDLPDAERGPLPVPRPDARVRALTSIAPGRLREQQRALDSWLVQGLEPHSVNYPDEIQRLAPFFPHVRFHEARRDSRPLLGRPRIFLGELVALARELLDAEPGVTAGIVNSDVGLYALDLTALAAAAAQSLVYSNRMDVPLKENMPAFAAARLYPFGYDAFFFSRASLPRFDSAFHALGEPWWDYCLPLLHMFADQGAPAVQAWPPLGWHVAHGQYWRDDVWRDFGLRSAAMLKQTLKASAHPLAPALLDALSQAEARPETHIARFSNLCCHALNTNPARADLVRRAGPDA